MVLLLGVVQVSGRTVARWNNSSQSADLVHEETVRAQNKNNGKNVRMCVAIVIGRVEDCVGFHSRSYDEQLRRPTKSLQIGLD